jgi:hypothetical protein
MLGTHLLVILGQVPGVGSIVRRCSALHATWRCFQSLSLLSQSLSIHGARGSGFLLRASRSNAHSPIRRSLMLAPSTQLDAPCAPGAQAAAISAAARSLRTGCKHESEPRMDVCGERKLRRSVSKLPIQKICINLNRKRPQLRQFCYSDRTEDTKGTDERSNDVASGLGLLLHPHCLWHSAAILFQASPFFSPCRVPAATSCAHLESTSQRWDRTGIEP